jgi:hypothetical protein
MSHENGMKTFLFVEEIIFNVFLIAAGNKNKLKIEGE